jgi:hypothetical protein
LGSWELPRTTAHRPSGIGIAGTPWVISAVSCMARSRAEQVGTGGSRRCPAAFTTEVRSSCSSRRRAARGSGRSRCVRCVLLIPLVLLEGTGVCRDDLLLVGRVGHRVRGNRQRGSVRLPFEDVRCRRSVPGRSWMCRGSVPGRAHRDPARPGPWQPPAQPPTYHPRAALTVTTIHKRSGPPPSRECGTATGAIGRLRAVCGGIERAGNAQRRRALSGGSGLYAAGSSERGTRNAGGRSRGAQGCMGRIAQVE